MNHPLHEKEVLEKVRELYKPNGLLVDVGANDGMWMNWYMDTYHLPAVGLEPSVTMLGILRRQYCGKDVHILPYAAGNFTGFAKMLTGKNPGHNTILAAHPLGAEMSGSQVVPVIELDVLFSPETDIGMIKIDVEGAEIQVLEGAVGLLANRPFLVVECHSEQTFSEARKYMNVLHEMKYGAGLYLLGIGK